MKYSILSTLITWLFPTKEDRNNFRTFCKNIDERNQSQIIQKRYPALIQKLSREFQNRKLKVVFLNSENAKWVYQSLYEELNEHPKFDVQVLLTIQKSLTKKKNKFLNYKKMAKNNYQFFKEKGMNVEFAFNFKRKRYKDLKQFKPDIIFYEQPWEVSEIHSIYKTSKYALPFYCAYGSCITNGKNEYSESFYKDVYTYFLDNQCIKDILLEHGFREQSLNICGQIKLDAYTKPINYLNSRWNTEGKKRIIYAPHHSFHEESTLGFGTFDWNCEFFYNFAKTHPEYEFIIKPHPALKQQIVNQKLMSAEDMFKYFEKWEELPNAQLYEFGNYFDIFRTSDLLITDCNSFLYEYLPTKNPVIHLIGKYSVGHNDFGQKIISGYYSAKNVQELEHQIEQVLFKGEDPLRIVREQLLNKDLIQPKEGMAKYITNYICKELGNV